MEQYVLQFNEIDKTCLPYVGGKGANLGEMTKAGFPVPQGFCVTTQAYRSFISKSSGMDQLFKRLDGVNPDDLEQIGLLGLSIRNHLIAVPMPDEVKLAILTAWEASGTEKAYAVRSSATAEDLPTASFAGQQDTYLNIMGEEQLLNAIKKCWASLFTDRAISYRAKNKFEHRSVFLSVVIQEMVFPDAAGIMFTADPITGRRKTVCIDASYGLGEALVSGLVTADLYQVRFGSIIKKQISKKKIAIYSKPEGGTETRDVPAEKQEMQTLPDERILELSELGRKIEAHYGSEQDIEWGFAGGRFYILQARPITSLYPLPPPMDSRFHVFMSFGHLQMMIDAMKPLAISLFSNITNYLKEDPGADNNFILSVGGRVYADMTGPLLFRPSRRVLLKVMKGMDELLAAGLSEAVGREEFRSLKPNKRGTFRIVRKMAPVVIPTFFRTYANIIFKDPSKAGNNLNTMIEKIIAEYGESISGTTGAERIRRIRQGMGSMLPDVLPRVVGYLIAGVLASGSLKRKLTKKVGENQAAYLLSQLNKSLPGNVVTELGLAMGDLSDTALKYPEVAEYLQKGNGTDFYEGLLKVSGGSEFKRELDGFLNKYGMRCAGEIDITQTRWYEDPTQLIPSIISGLRKSERSEHRKKYEQGRLEAEKAEKDIIAQFGFLKRRKITRLTSLYRNLMGLREHHKFLVITLLGIYKRAILEEARILASKGLLQSEYDVYYLTLDELISVLENKLQGNILELVEMREKQHALNEKLNPPRVMTSEGEIVTGKIRSVKAPEGALTGLPVSAGTVEGIARVILRLEDAMLNPGEILVAPYTDPGWTPLFISAAGLVTEVGGMMTHGSVVAREYGIPAVAGIEKATEIIKSGDRIKVNGTEGYVQILR